MKIICCGPPKTGTKSLIRALDLLNFKSLHNNSIERFEKESYQCLAEGDAVIKWKEFYYKYPDSKFILTLRENWEKVKFANYNKEKHLSHRFPSIYEKGMDPKIVYEKHIESIRDFFKDKPNQLLEMNILKGDGWEKLIPFLKKYIKAPIKRKMKKSKFPHVKIAKVVNNNDQKINRLRRINR